MKYKIILCSDQKIKVLSRISLIQVNFHEHHALDDIIWNMPMSDNLYKQLQVLIDWFTNTF